MGVTLNQFREKYEGHSIAEYADAHSMRKLCVGSIAFHQEMLRDVPKKHRHIRQNHEETIRQYERMLADLEGAA